MFLKCYIRHSAFLDCLWLTVIKEINVLRSFISDINDRLFPPQCFDVCRRRSAQGALWSQQSFYLPLFTLVKVLSGLLVQFEGCNALQPEIYRKGNCNFCMLLSGTPSNKSYLCKWKGWRLESTPRQNQMFWNRQPCWVGRCSVTSTGAL